MLKTLSGLKSENQIFHQQPQGGELDYSPPTSERSRGIFPQQRGGLAWDEFKLSGKLLFYCDLRSEKVGVVSQERTRELKVGKLNEVMKRWCCVVKTYPKVIKDILSICFHTNSSVVNNSSGGVFRMEPFHAEECHSSESGWTMYIGSPTDDGGHTDDEDHNHNEATQAHPQVHDHDESDDSMASDASSGPSHHHGFADFRPPAQDKYRLDLEKKANKTQHKQMEGEKLQKKGIFLLHTKDKSPVQGRAKVRKNYFLGKNK
ncbi:hypothetical protein VNO78_23644 [Psophocarpus tetragonolobus]|uniref:Uncharacterized protein n=1 Tax=Psophocarpus tetragonolobus TaxID=3891 RepID=A0AAN9S409_PSOTE